MNQQLDGSFDKAFYRKTYADVAASGMDPWTHYTQYGRNEGRAANAAELRFSEEEPFDAAFYLEANPDVATAAISPYVHFLRFGRAEGRAAVRPQLAREEPRQAAHADYPLFDAVFYFEAFPDIAASGMTALDHYLQYGRFEGRVTHALDVAAQWRADRLDPERETVLVVAHNATRTGAPILALSICQEFAKRLNVIAVLLAGGPLVEHFQDACAQTVVLTEPELRHPLVLDYLIKDINARADVSHAIVNSSESRMCVEPLVRRDYRVVLLIHEFVSYMHSRAATMSAINLATSVVFSAQSVLDDAFDGEAKDALGASVVLRQGRSPIPPRSALGQVRPERAAEIEASEGSVAPDAATLIEALLQGQASKPRIVLGAGTVQFRKGVDLFFATAAEFRRRFPEDETIFVWIGEDDESDLSFTACLKLLLRQIEMLKGRAYLLRSTDRLDALYARADVFFLASRMDPLPNVGIDAMTAGLPLLCFEGAGGITEVLQNSSFHDLSIVPFANIAEAADRIGKLVSEESLRERVGEENRRLADEKFNMREYVDELVDLAWGRGR